MTPLLGCIADDITGATDLALMLGKHGMPVTQYIGVPDASMPAPDTPAVVIALKTRTVPRRQAIEESLAAYGWLAQRHTQQFFFKYCSTFDSTQQGNIGPVAEALRQASQSDLCVVCPAFPANQRTVYMGHLFVGEQLLSRSSMRHHPLTPMTESNLLTFLGRQLTRPSEVGLIPYAIIEQGPQAIVDECRRLVDLGRSFAVVDALNNEHLLSLARACQNHRLITGGSAIAMGLPDNFHRTGKLPKVAGLVASNSIKGNAVILAGSCSVATLGQVKYMSARAASLQLDPIALHQGQMTIKEILVWCRAHIAKGPLLIYSSASPDEISKAQERLGQIAAGAIIEHTLAEIAVALKQMDLTKLIVAGGETSGAVLAAMGIRRLRIGPEIEPGVPWTLSDEASPLWLALKSGNFGSEAFFSKALEMIS